jgi:hypothetical protein
MVCTFPKAYGVWLLCGSYVLCVFLQEQIKDIIIINHTRVTDSLQNK